MNNPWILGPHLPVSGLPGLPGGLQPGAGAGQSYLDQLASLKD